MQSHHPFYVVEKWEGYRNKLGFIDMLGIQAHNYQLTFQYWGSPVELISNIKDVFVRFQNVSSITSLF